MEITNNNWTNVTVDYILDSLRNADYVSVDTELTGIDVNSKNFIDSLEERYIQCANCVNKYQIMQLGITTFKIGENLSTKTIYECKPFNIYLFPPQSYGNQNIHMEISAINFNREHNFDFNKWIYGGVEYLNDKQIDEKRKFYLERDVNTFKSYTPVQLKTDDYRQKQKENVDSVKLFLENKNLNSILIVKPKGILMVSLMDALTKEDKEKLYFTEEYISECKCEVNNNLESKSMVTMEVEVDSEIKLNSKCKKGDIIGEACNLKEEQYLKIYKVKDENHRKELEKYYKEVYIEDLISRKKGAKILFDELVKLKIPIIGHNCLLDFMFLITHFSSDMQIKLPKTETNKPAIENDYLPITIVNVQPVNLLTEFKKKFNELFYETYDTRYLFSIYSKLFNIGFSETNLETLYCYFLSKNKTYKETHEINLTSTNPIIIKNKYLEFNVHNLDPNKKYHDAAYDSYVTGCLYLMILNDSQDSPDIKNFSNKKFNLIGSMYKEINMLDMENNEETIYPNTFFMAIVINQGIKMNNLNLKDLYSLLESKKRLAHSYKDFSVNSVVFFIKKGSISISNMIEGNQSEVIELEEDFINKLYDLLDKLNKSEIKSTPGTYNKKIKSFKEKQEKENKNLELKEKVNEIINKESNFTIITDLNEFRKLVNS